MAPAVPHKMPRCAGARQLAAGQGNDDGVVAAQQDVDHDDLTDGDPELGGHELFHGFFRKAEVGRTPCAMGGGG